MRQSPFIWLGSGRTRKRGVAHKGKMLDMAARGGLPVPQAGILLDEFYRICLSEGLIELIGDRVIITDPVWLHEVLYQDVRFPRLKGDVAVRSATASSSSDQPQNFSQLGVDFDDPQQMATSLRKVWSAMEPQNESCQMDVIVMEMVAVQTRGVAISAQEEAEDETTVRGDSQNPMGNHLLLPRLRAFRGLSADMSPYARRLQRLLSGMRRTFGRGNYEIEWADDGRICWLLQIL